MWLEQKPIANVDVSDISPSRLGRKCRAVQFLIFGDDIEQKVEIERGAPSGIFDVFASVRAEQIIGEGA